MAPLAPSNTARFRFHYTTVGQNHTLQIRSTSSPVAVGEFFRNIMEALGTSIFSLTLNSVDFAAIGSDIFNPIVTGQEGEVWGTGPGADFNTPWALTFIGRTTGGRRVRMAVFGYSTLSGNYRVNPTESILVDAAIDALQAAAGGIIGIDGLTPVWYEYANVQVNDHWVKEIR